MFGLSVSHLLLVLVIVLLLFGTKKLSTLGADLGTAIKGFKNALSTEPEKPAEEPRVIDGEVERQNQKP